MPRVVRLGCAVALAFAAFSVQAVELPSRVLACSCAGAPSLEHAAASIEQYVLVGTLGRAEPGGHLVEVETWFKGPFEGNPVVGGFGPQSAACQVGAGFGERWLLTVHTRDGRSFATNSCLPSARLGTADGDALLAEATALFGQPNAPPSPDPVPPAQVDLSPWLGSGLVYAGVATLVALAMFGAIALVARRRPQR